VRGRGPLAGVAGVAHVTERGRGKEGAAAEGGNRGGCARWEGRGLARPHMHGEGRTPGGLVPYPDKGREGERGAGGAERGGVVWWEGVF
jgi:hypothetical protein